jgi:protein ImuB
VINANSVKRRYLALWFPFLSTDRWRIAQTRQNRNALQGQAGTAPPDTAEGASPAGDDRQGEGALRLCAVDARAGALGIAPGMTLADARALEPELVVAEMDAGADRHWLERLARHCLDWTPRVSLAAPDGITLDIAGVDHLFGGEAGLCAQVEDGMAGIGMALRWAAASTRKRRRHWPAMAHFPFGTSGSHPGASRAGAGARRGSTLALNRAGLKRVGDLTVRPAAAIAARFGVGAVSALSA